MPIGMYRTRTRKHLLPSCKPDTRDRGHSYIETPATLEKAFAEALELGRARLAQQREQIKREAAVQRGR